MTPQAGDIAVCSLGRVGMISDPTPRKITYSGGKKGTAYVGKTIAPPEFFGQPWSSREPKIIGHISDLSEACTATEVLKDIAPPGA